MKEMPGAPALPEGWFYRVYTEKFGSTGYRVYVQVRRPFAFGWSIPWGGSSRVRNGSWDFFQTYEKPTPGQLARAAKNAYMVTDENGIEGDYR